MTESTSGRRVLVTGGSGFIGTNLVAHHVAAGDAVMSVDVAAPRKPEHSSCWREVDLLDRDGLRRAFGEFEPTHVLHMAARTDLHGRAVSDYEANTQGLRNVIDQVDDLPTIERVVFASSRMVCKIDHRPVGDDDYSPPNAYGESKMLGERLVREAGLDVEWTLVRPTSIWGPWFGVPYKDFFTAIARGRYVHVRGHSVRKSFGYVGNTIHELEQLLSAPKAKVHGRTFYLGDYPPIETSTMADEIARALGASPIRTVPLAPLKLAARTGDGLQAIGWREPPLTSFRLSNLLTEMVYDLRPLEEVVGGPLPYSMTDGVRETVGWLRSAGEV